jgi:hypothetical protein
MPDFITPVRFLILYWLQFRFFSTIDFEARLLLIFEEIISLRSDSSFRLNLLKSLWHSIS